MGNFRSALSEINWITLTFSLLIIPAGLNLIKFVIRLFKERRPALLFLDRIYKNDETCKIFIRDLIKEKNSKLLAIEPNVGIGEVPNVINVYPEVEGKGISYIFNVLGKVGKTKNIELIGLGEDRGEWNSNVILLGGQSQKHMDFYRHMINVAYRMDDKEIYNNITNEIVVRENGFGYGIILKSGNPYFGGKDPGNAILLGGFGVLGTQAAAYYFKEHFVDLGRDFKKNCFGIVVRSPISAGVEAVERLKEYDYCFNNKSILFMIKSYTKKSALYTKTTGVKKKKQANATMISSSQREEVNNETEQTDIRPSGIV